ncbi:hypothetical protein ERO13_A12G238300v2 [Gossypium hirsutum]|nr:hypothetical protein ERO13_A12G238300v2 [Gossypium hirsutum]
MVEISGMDLRLSCLEQRLRTCREFVSLGGLSQQSLVFEAHRKHHKRYIFPVEQTLNDVAETIFEFHPDRMPARLDLHQFNNIGIQAVAAETPSESITDAIYALHSPQSLPRKSLRLFTSISMNQRQGQTLLATFCSRVLDLLCRDHHLRAIRMLKNGGRRSLGELFQCPLP